MDPDKEAPEVSTRVAEKEGGVRAGGGRCVRAREDGGSPEAIHRIRN